MEAKHSGLGIASFILSLGAGLLILITFVIAGVLNQGHVQRGETYPGQMLVGFAIIGLLASDVLAIALGIATLCQSGKKRLFGIMGLVISSATILGTIAISVIGLLFLGHAR